MANYIEFLIVEKYYGLKPSILIEASKECIDIEIKTINGYPLEKLPSKKDFIEGYAEVIVQAKRGNIRQAEQVVRNTMRQIYHMKIFFGEQEKRNESK